MNFAGYKSLVQSDLHRLHGRTSLSAFLRALLLGGSDGAYQYIFWMRTCRYARTHPLLNVALYPVARLALRRYGYRYGIDIPYDTIIGSGFYIGHFGGIVINSRAVIGRNCNISQQVTLGQANRGPRKGCPTVGDNTYIGPGAKIVGAVRIGDNVAVGANCVVTKDVPDNAVVVGVPSRIVSFDGAAHYVEFNDYEM